MKQDKTKVLTIGRSRSFVFDNRTVYRLQKMGIDPSIGTGSFTVTCAALFAAATDSPDWKSPEDVAMLATGDNIKEWGDFVGEALGEIPLFQSAKDNPAPSKNDSGPSPSPSSTGTPIPTGT